MKTLRCILLLTFMLILHAGIAQVITIRQDQGIQKFSHFTEVFLDSSGTLKPEDLIQPKYLSKFRPAKSDFENFNITPDILWIHFRMTADRKDIYLLQTSSPFINEVRLYKRQGNSWSEHKSGLNIPVDKREFKINTLTFPLNIQPGDTGEYFIRMQSYFPLINMMTAGTEHECLQKQFEDSLFAGLFFGIMLIMALYNLFLFLTNRDRVYIYYVLYVIGTVIFISLTNGTFSFYPEIFRTIYSWSHVFFLALFGYFGLFFTMRFLNTKKYVPRLHKLFIWMMAVVSSILFIGKIDPHLGTNLIQLTGIVLSVLCIIAGFTVLKKGYAPARYYLFGYGFYMLGLLIYILLAFLQVDTGWMTPPRILMSSSAIEAIILSFAIGDKLNIAIQDKQAAQEKVIEAVRENERIVREQNVVLEKKVDERTAEIIQQKAIIEEKNKDILDSIHYAKRIQRALLASDSLLKKNLPEYFVLYKPKDIVSGDFYWADEMADGKFLLITGDCTGHGVPGAFMSLLNISILHELTNGMKLSQPDQILNTQRDAIIMSLNPEGSNEVSKDGMDCVLCSFDLKNKKLEFACANNPLWLLRNGEMIEYRPDKFPIGLHEGEKKMYRLQTIDLLPGDIVYTFTDGFADQFGGPRGKKFKYKQLKEKLMLNAALPMKDQQQNLDTVFEEWRGGLEQVDDVLVVGVRV